MVRWGVEKEWKTCLLRSLLKSVKRHKVVMLLVSFIFHKKKESSPKVKGT